MKTMKSEGDSETSNVIINQSQKLDKKAKKALLITFNISLRTSRDYQFKEKVDKNSLHLFGMMIARKKPNNIDNHQEELPKGVDAKDFIDTEPRFFSSTSEDSILRNTDKDETQAISVFYSNSTSGGNTENHDSPRRKYQHYLRRRLLEEKHKEGEP